MKNQKTMGNKGFSLVELIVVIAIMAVLVGVLAPQFIKYVSSSKLSTDIQNAQQMKTAVEVDYADGTITSTPVTISKDGTSLKCSTSLSSTKQEVPLKAADKWGAFEYKFDGTKWTMTTGKSSGEVDGKSIDKVFE